MLPVLVSKQRIHIAFNLCVHKSVGLVRYTREQNRSVLPRNCLKEDFGVSGSNLGPGLQIEVTTRLMFLNGGNEIDDHPPFTLTIGINRNHPKASRYLTISSALEA